MKKQLLVLGVLFCVFISCNNSKSFEQDAQNTQPDYSIEYYPEYDNPIDSITQSVYVENCVKEVYQYIVSHPGFIENSQSTGTCTTNCSNGTAWVTLDGISIYSIPFDEECGYYVYRRNMVQYKNNENQWVVDTVILHDDVGELSKIYKKNASNGKSYYLLITEFDVMRQGESHVETIYSFSIDEKGELVREPLFKTKKASYDEITVACGGQRWLPLAFDELCLIYCEGDEDNIQHIKLAEINENDWPTGLGLDYVWNGCCFEYKGKCKYDANGDNGQY